ncbi:MAG: hypothetical protein JRN57_03450 [Nitrososphaerota archaeon]|nr:hypothetical protein [Nitrososphaerota archaeon]
MDVLEEIISHLSGSSRAVVISDGDVDLRQGGGDLGFFLLKIGEGSLAAGGRGGGFGERKVTAALFFRRRGGSWSKPYEAKEETAAAFEVPYHVSRLPMTMADGTESMGYGVVDPDLVREMMAKAAISSSA